MGFGKEGTRKEIEAKLATQGDYVKINYLTACLGQNLDFDTRRFVQVQLSKLYETKGMYGEAAKLIRASADINTTFQAKIADFLKSAELFARAGDFDEADVSISKALASANSKEKLAVKAQQKTMYLTQARALLQKDKRKNAMEAFEKVLSLDSLTPAEKDEVQKNLLFLYEKLGKIREFMALKKSV
ncbi:MAG TPA: hypothetical protein VHA12_03370 [Candidatus Nanoarchaeia archaeon]|nr:hypothetical protein [Candidatus Nanoarchaeia archaeon]